MYQYQKVDQSVVDARVEEYRDQVNRFLDGKISDDEFLQLNFFCLKIQMFN